MGTSETGNRQTDTQDTCFISINIDRTPSHVDSTGLRKPHYSLNLSLWCMRTHKYERLFTRQNKKITKTKTMPPIFLAENIIMIWREYILLGVSILLSAATQFIGWNWKMNKHKQFKRNTKLIYNLFDELQTIFPLYSGLLKTVFFTLLNY